MSEAFGAVLDHVLGPHGLVVYDAADPAAKPFARRLILKAPGRSRPDLGAGRCRRRCARGPRLPRTGRRRRRRRAALPDRRHPAVDPLSRGHRRGRRPGDAAGRAHSAGRPRPRALQPQRAIAPAGAGHDLPHRLLRRWPERARLPRPAARGLRAFRGADAAGGAARVGVGRRLGGAAFPGQARHPAHRSSSARTSSPSTSCSRASCPRRWRPASPTPARRWSSGSTR